MRDYHRRQQAKPISYKKGDPALAEREDEPMSKPLTSKEYQRWKDAALLDGDIVDRFAATIDNLRSGNSDLIGALEKLTGWAEGIIDNLETGSPLIGPKLRREVLLPARAVIKSARF